MTDLERAHRYGDTEIRFSHVISVDFESGTVLYGNCYMAMTLLLYGDDKITYSIGLVQTRQSVVRRVLISFYHGLLATFHDLTCNYSLAPHHGDLR